jgi:hypothetical protein
VSSSLEGVVYRLDFTDKFKVLSIEPKERFAVCMQAIASTQRPTPPEAWDDVIGLLKKLKSVADEKRSDGKIEYELKLGGAVIELERGERTQLLEFIRTSPWNPMGLETVRGVREWITSLTEE